MSFMSLPPEIRIKVYKLLLTSKSRPQDRPFGPRYNLSVLHVNKLVYLEASLVLYTSNALTLDLGHHSFWNVQPMNGTQWRFTAKDQPLRLRKGTIYPEGLRQVQHIEIRIDSRALWASSSLPAWYAGDETGPQWPTAAWSKNARTLTKLLCCLGADRQVDEVEWGRKKTLKLYVTLQCYLLVGQGADQATKRKQDLIKTKLKWFMSLLEDVRKRRKVEVETKIDRAAVSVGRVDEERLGLVRASGKRVRSQSV